MTQRQVKVARPETGVLVGRGGGVTRHGPGPDNRAEERVPGCVGLGPQCRRHGPHQRTPALTGPDAVGGGDDHSGGTVVGRARHHRRQRLGHQLRRQDLVGSHAVVGTPIAPGAQCAVVPVLGGDGGEVPGLGAVVVHPPLGPEREVGRRQDRRIDLIAPGAAARSAVPCHVGHLVERQGQRHLGAPRCHRPRCLPERHEARGGGVFDVGHRQPGQAKLLYGLDAEQRRRLDVAHERLVDVGQGHAGIVQGRQPGLARQVGAAAVGVPGEADHADAGHRHALDPHAPASPPA